MLKIFGVLIGLMCCALGPLAVRADERLSVTFINPGGPVDFWGDVSATMAAAANDLEIDLEIIHTERDRLEMVEAARALSQRTVLPDHVIIVNELQQAPVMLDLLQSTDVPVFVLLNRMTADQRREYEASGATLSQIVASIVPDNEIAGYEMAVSIIDAARTLGLDGDGLTMLALLGDAATPAALAREAGLMRALDENPDVDLVRALPVMWSHDTAYERTVSVLARYELDAIWAANDQIALGAQRAAREAGEVPGSTMTFAGLNWSGEGLSAVRNGAMTMTHGGHFFAGAWSMVMIRDIANGKLPEGSHLGFPMSAVRAENAERFIDLFGGRNWDAIDFRSFTLSAGQHEDYRFTAEAILEAAVN